MEFMLNLFMLLRMNGGPPRAATREWDYVIAVVADLGYPIPSDYKTKGVGNLLQDALKWIRARNGYTELSFAPQGLFEPNATESTIWQPSYYLSSGSIRSVLDVYGTLSCHGSVALHSPDRIIWIRCQKSNAVVLSAEAKTWETLSADSTSAQNLARVFASITANWNYTYLKEARSAVRDSVFRDDPALDEKTVQLLDSLVTKCNITDGYGGQPYSLHDVYGGIYQSVCHAMQLNTEFCAERGVRVMFSGPTDQSPQRCPRVGLFRRDVDLKRGVDSGEILTITMWLATTSVLFEAERTGTHHDGIPAYRVFGVWVPTKTVADEDFGALCMNQRSEGEDAVLF